MRAMHWVLMVSAALVGFVAASNADDPSCGTIDTDGAVISVGTAPTMGQLVEDACAVEASRPVVPDLPDPGALGTFTASPGNYAAPPDISPATPQPFHATTSQTLAVGNHVFTSFTVDPGVTVAVQSGAEIWTTGDVLVEGRMRFSGAGLFHCGGDFTIDGGMGYSEIVTGDTTGPIDIQVGGNFHCNAGDAVISARQGLRIETFGAPPTSGQVLIEGLVWAIRADVDIAASGEIRLSGDSARIEADYGKAELRAFGGDVALTSFARLTPADSDDADPTVIEAAGGISVTGGAEIEGGRDTSLQMTAFGGDVLIQESVVYVAGENHDAWVRASGSVIVEGDDSYLNLDCSDHTVEVTAFGGAVEFREFEPEFDRSYIGGRMVKIAAATDVRLERVDLDSSAGADAEQSIVVYAHGGRIVADGRVRISAQEGRAGTTTLHGSEGIALTGWTGSAIDANGAGGLQMFGGLPGIDLDMPYVDAAGGDGVFLASGPIGLDTDVGTLGDLRIVSTRSWVDASGVSLSTDNVQDGSPSGSIVVESWAGSAGRVDVSGATVGTGTSTARSGDVTLRVVHAGGTTEVDSYLVPKKVKVKVGRKDAADSLMTLLGDLDLGSTGPDLTKPATLRIGDRVFDLPGLVVNSKGNQFTHRDNDLDIKVIADKRGSSRCGFKIKLRGDPSDVGDPDGTLVLGFACDAMDARCAVAVSGGSFVRGRVRGAIVEPRARLEKAAVVVKGAGKDKLTLKFGLTSGSTPDHALDVEIGVGDVWSATVTGDRFVRKKETYRFKGDADGLRKVIVDYGREGLTVSGKGLDLGPHVDESGLLRIHVRVGVEEFVVSVQARVKGGKQTY